MGTTNDTNFAMLLEQAVNEPGMISKAYTAFHGYSMSARHDRSEKWKLKRSQWSVSKR